MGQPAWQEYHFPLVQKSEVSVSDAFPVGSVFIAVVPTNPSTLLGYGTWQGLGAGKVLVGLDPSDPDFDTPEKTAGAKTVASAGSVAAPSLSGNTAMEASHTHGVTSNVAVGDHASHTHAYTEIVNHTHAVNITDGGHTHTQNAHTHPSIQVQGGTTAATTGTHIMTSTAVGGSSRAATSPELANSATAVNQSATTGITATTSNPAGGVASGTTTGPSATLTHAVTNNAVTSGTGSAHSHAVGSLAASAPAFTGQATSVVQPSLVVFFWKRVA